MLVISRRKGQCITIGDDIQIVVTAVHKGGIKLGIVAPRGVTVLRGEVRDAISAANREAALSSIEHATALVDTTPGVTPTSLSVSKLALGRQSDDRTPSESKGVSPVPSHAPSGTKPVPS
jgi:carbon storage regulator